MCILENIYSPMKQHVERFREMWVDVFYANSDEEFVFETNDKIMMPLHH